MNEDEFRKLVIRYLLVFNIWLSIIATSVFIEVWVR